MSVKPELKPQAAKGRSKARAWVMTCLAFALDSSHGLSRGCLCPTKSSMARDEVDQEDLPYTRSSWHGGPEMPPGMPGPPTQVLHRRHLKRFEAFFNEARLGVDRVSSSQVDSDELEGLVAEKRFDAKLTERVVPEGLEPTWRPA